ncbi:MAG TPA: sigma-70 family RNA polymerase sigma factor [Thermoanaerobaculia bacterium]|jgi:RNA polymerase sigma-70 factor (ECF subfamily)|nr:sigma-70 family RNA polymerase sigma factor [Thermoanaerobaculia bacterium]
MPDAPVEATAVLLDRARRGDAAARDRLAARFLPLLQRWAHGRLPPRARGAVDTDDLVQVTLVKALERLASFEPRHEGAFLAYLRRILLNKLRDEIRRAGPGRQPLDERLPAPLSLVEETIGREVVARYEEALQELEQRQRESVILRLEFGYSHEEVAAAVGCPTANAARMLVSRALVRLAELLDGRV